MQTVTQVLTPSTPFTITKKMNVLCFSAVGLTSGTTFTYTGTAAVTNQSATADLTPTAITFSGQYAYNSRVAPQNSPWENITITCTAGSVALELSTF